MDQHGLHAVSHLVWGWGIRMAGKPVAQGHGNAGNLNHETEGKGDRDAKESRYSEGSRKELEEVSLEAAKRDSGL